MIIGSKFIFPKIIWFVRKILIFMIFWPSTASLWPITWAACPNLGHFWLILASKQCFLEVMRSIPSCELRNRSKIYSSRDYIVSYKNFNFCDFLTIHGLHMAYHLGSMDTFLPFWDDFSVKNNDFHCFLEVILHDLTIKKQIIHNALKSIFEKIYFFKEIYLISRKINFGSIMILIG